MNHLKYALWFEGENWFKRHSKRPKHDWKWNLVNIVWPVLLVSRSPVRFQWFRMHARYVRCRKVFPGLKNQIAVPFRRYANFRRHTGVFTMCKGKHTAIWPILTACLHLVFQTNREVKSVGPWRYEWKTEQNANGEMFAHRGDKIRQWRKKASKRRWERERENKLPMSDNAHALFPNLQHPRCAASAVKVVHPSESPHMCGWTQTSH